MKFAGFFLTSVIAFAFVSFVQNGRAEESPSRFSEVSNLLSSPLAEDQSKGRQILTENETEIIEDAIDGLHVASSEEAVPLLEALIVCVSPWQRGVASTRRHRGSICLGTIQRPVDRPTDHKFAESLAHASLARLDAIETIREPTRDFFFRTEELSHLSALLIEISTPTLIEKLATRLRKIDDITKGAAVLSIIEAYYFLPTGFRETWICGNSTKEEVSKFEESQDRNFRSARDLLLQYHEKGKHWNHLERYKAGFACWSDWFDES